MNSIPDASRSPVEDVERALPLIGFFIARQFRTEGYNILSRVLWCSQHYPNCFDSDRYLSCPFPACNKEFLQNSKYYSTLLHVQWRSLWSISQIPGSGFILRDICASDVAASQAVDFSQALMAELIVSKP